MELTRAQRFNRAMQRYQLSSELVKIEVYKSLMSVQRRINRREIAGKVCTITNIFRCYHQLYNSSTITMEDFSLIAEHFGKITIVQYKHPDSDKITEYVFSPRRDGSLEEACKFVMASEEAAARKRWLSHARAKNRYQNRPEIAAKRLKTAKEKNARLRREHFEKLGLEEYGKREPGPNGLLLAKKTRPIGSGPPEDYIKADENAGVSEPKTEQPSREDTPQSGNEQK